MNLCLKHSIKTVAFCCIGTGIYSFPRELAGNIAFTAIKKILTEHDNYKKFERIIFVVFDYKDEKMYNALLPVYFPVKNPKKCPKDPEELYEYRQKLEKKRQFEKVRLSTTFEIEQVIRKFWKDSKKQNLEISKIEGNFAKRMGYGKQTPWKSLKQLEEEENHIPTEEEIKKKEEEEKLQMKKDHQTCINFGIYKENFFNTAYLLDVQLRTDISVKTFDQVDD